MNTQPQQNNSTALDMFGKACGFIVAVLFTMPLNALTYDYLVEYVLRYSNFNDNSLLEWLWIACIFFFIFSAVWCLTVLLIGLIQKTVLYLAIRFKLRNKGGW
jgi:hypothetical protein